MSALAESIRGMHVAIAPRGRVLWLGVIGLTASREDVEVPRSPGPPRKTAFGIYSAKRIRRSTIDKNIYDSMGVFG